MGLLYKIVDQIDKIVDSNGNNVIQMLVINDQYQLFTKLVALLKKKGKEQMISLMLEHSNHDGLDFGMIVVVNNRLQFNLVLDQ